MIIEKTYNLQDNPYPHLITTNEHYGNIATKIQLECLRVRMSDKLSPIIFCGLDIISALMCSRNYTPENNFLSRQIDDNIEFVGYLVSEKVYCDYNLEDNKILVGSNYDDIKYYNRKKKRKEKLLKIQNYEIRS